MALSVGNIVVLAIGAVLLATGGARVALYVIPPEPTPQGVYRWSPGQLQSTTAPRPADRILPTRAPLGASSANSAADPPAAPRPRATPNAVTPDFAQPPAEQGRSARTEAIGSASPAEDIVMPPSAVAVTEAMAPLGSKFLRMWHWEPETGQFIYYDPLVPEESTLETVASGQTYLILVTESVTLIVNGQELELVCNDGNCWNRVVWP